MSEDKKILVSLDRIEEKTVWANHPIIKPLILLLVLVFTQVSYGLRPVRGYPVVPSDYGIIYDPVTFETSDGFSLQGWFVPAQDTAGISNHLVGRLIPVPDSLKPPLRPYILDDVRAGATIVICPGDAGNMSFSILYAYNFFIRGFNVFTFDWRGFGKSEDWPVDPDLLIYAEFLVDYEAALDYLITRPETDPSRIGLLGFSTGAYMSFAMADSRDDIAALAARATITSFDDLLPILEQLDPGRAWHSPEGFPDSLLPVNAAPDILIPVLMVVGVEDERTPAWMSRRVFDLLAGPGELWIVEGAGHGGISAPEMVAYSQFFQRITEFFEQYL